jgi:hypothetical protein
MRDIINRVTIREGAAEAKCHGRTLRRAIDAGELESELAWGRVLITRAELARWIAARQSREPNAAHVATAVIAELLTEAAQP